MVMSPFIQTGCPVVGGGQTAVGKCGERRRRVAAERVGDFAPTSSINKRKFRNEEFHVRGGMAKEKSEGNENEHIE